MESHLITFSVDHFLACTLIIVSVGGKHLPPKITVDKWSFLLRVEILYVTHNFFSTYLNELIPFYYKMYKYTFRMY